MITRRKSLAETPLFSLALNCLLRSSLAGFLQVFFWGKRDKSEVSDPAVVKET